MILLYWCDAKDAPNDRASAARHRAELPMVKTDAQIRQLGGSAARRVGRSQRNKCVYALVCYPELPRDSAPQQLAYD